MNKRLAFLAVGVTILLTACGLVASFVPPIPVTEAVTPLDGQEFAATFTETETGETSAVLRSSDTLTFDDSAIVAEAQHTTVEEGMGDLVPEVNTYGFSVAQFDAEIGLGATATLTTESDAKEWPESFTLTAGSVDMTASDVVDDQERQVELGMSKDMDVTFVRDSGVCDVACEYTVEGGAHDALSVDLDDRDVIMDLIAILQEGDEETPNTVAFDVMLRADSEPSLEGFTATFTVKTGNAEINLGG